MSFTVRLSSAKCFHNHQHVADDAHAARRRYKKDLDLIKPDLVAYNRQKEIALGLEPGTLVRQPSASTVTNFNPTLGAPVVQVRVHLTFQNHAPLKKIQQQHLIAEDLYRDANSLLYADNKPTEDAIDRVVSKINREYVAVSTNVIISHIDVLQSISIDKKGQFSRKRHNEDEGDITYINEQNRVFNKKVSCGVLGSVRSLRQVLVLDCTIL
jgi:pre-mRNA-splicing factor SYF2